MRQDFVQTLNVLLDAVDLEQMQTVMQTHVDQGMGLLDASGTRFEAREATFELDMAYVGQTHTVSVPIPAKLQNGTVTPPSHAEIAEAFDAVYRANFGRLLPNGVRRILNLRSAVTGKRPKFDLTALAPGNTGDARPKATRRVHFGDAWYETAIYDRLTLPVGTIVDGPAILEQPDTTVLIEPGLQGRVDALGNTIIEARPEATT